MSHQFRPIAALGVALTALAGCGGSGDDGAPPSVAIRVPSLEAPAGGTADDPPAEDASPVADGATPEAEPSEDAPEASPVPAPRESEPAAVTTDGTSLPPEVDDRLRGVFEIANGDAIEFAVAVARRLIDVEVGPREDFTFSRSGTDAGTGVEDTTLLCPEGGTLDTTSSSLLSSDGTYILRECDVGPLVLNGTIEGRVRGPDRETDGVVVIEPNYAFDDFSVRDSRSGRTIVIADGRIVPTGIDTAPAIRFGYGVISAYGSDKTVGAGSVYDERGDRTVVALGPAVTRTRSNPTVDFPLGGMTTGFDVRFGTEPVRAEVVTVAPFDGLDPEGRFARGSLTIVSEEGGYAYTLDAASGDPATFRLDVVEDGTTTSYLVPWSAALGFDAFEPEAIDVGF